MNLFDLLKVSKIMGSPKTFGGLAADPPSLPAVWDCRSGTPLTADGPGMVYMNGLVGHKGKCGCRLFCGAVGTNLPGMPQHYLVIQKPGNAQVSMQQLVQVNLIDPQQYKTALTQVIASKNITSYKKKSSGDWHLQTKPF